MKKLMKKPRMLTSRKGMSFLLLIMLFTIMVSIITFGYEYAQDSQLYSTMYKGSVVFKLRDGIAALEGTDSSKSRREEQFFVNPGSYLIIYDCKSFGDEDEIDLGDRKIKGSGLESLKEQCPDARESKTLIMITAIQQEGQEDILRYAFETAVSDRDLEAALVFPGGGQLYKIAMVRNDENIRNIHIQFSDYTAYEDEA